MPNTTNFNFPTPADTDLVKDGASAIRSLGNSIDTAFVDLKGGTTGQILSKASNTDLDYTWIANDQGDITEVQAGTGISVASGTGPIPVVTNTVATTFDAKGDLVAGTGADTFAKLTVGANNTVLTADSTTATGLKWATPAAGGKVLQVVSATTSATFSSSSTSYVDITGLSVSITPASTSSKIMIFYVVSGQGRDTGVTFATQLVRGSTAISLGDAAAGKTQSSSATSRAPNANDTSSLVVNFLDSPNTTSATTYKVQGIGTGATWYVNTAENDGFRFTSSITAFEIGA